MAKRVQLSHAQFYAFGEWLKKGATELFAEPQTYKSIALKAQDALGFPISDSSVRGVLEITGLLEEYLRAAGRSEKLQATPEIRLLAQQLKAVCVGLGMATLPGIEDLAK